MPSNRYDELPDIAQPLPTPHRVLTIGAHPDDAEFGAGGTLARWAAAGASVVILVVTDGSKGSWDPSADTASLIERRKAEQAAAANRIGATACEHFGYVDGELEYSMGLRTELALAMRRHRPDIVLTHDPWQRYQLHPDHRATGLAALDAVVTAREPLALRGTGTVAHRPTAVLLWSADEPDHAEPVDGPWLDAKVDALLCHASQSETTMGDALVDSDRESAFREEITAWLTASGRSLGAGPSETFKRLTP